MELQRALEGQELLLDDDTKYDKFEENEQQMKELSVKRCREAMKGNPKAKIIEDESISHYPWKYYLNSEDPYIITYPVTIICRAKKNDVVTISTATMAMTYPFFFGLNIFQNNTTQSYRYFIGEQELMFQDITSREGDQRYRVELKGIKDRCYFQHDDVFRGILTFLNNENMKVEPKIYDKKGREYKWEESS